MTLSGPAPALELRTQDGVGPLALRVEPEAVQFVTETVAYQLERSGQGLCGGRITDQHHLRGPRRTFDDHLQVARDATMRRFDVRRHVGIDQRAAHDGGDTVDQRVVDHAVRNRDDAMRAELEHAQFRRARPPADREARPLTEASGRASAHRHGLDAMRCGKSLECVERCGCNARLAEAGAARARRSMRTCRGRLSMAWGLIFSS